MLILVALRKSKAGFNRFCPDTLMLEYKVALWMIASIPRGRGERATQTCYPVCLPGHSHSNQSKLNTPVATSEDKPEGHIPAAAVLSRLVKHRSQQSMRGICNRECVSDSGATEAGDLKCPALNEVVLGQ